MAIIYRVKDGRNSARSDQGTYIDIRDLTSKLKKHKVRYINQHLPYINANNPTKYYRRVIIQITGEESLNNLFNKVGFYIIENIDLLQSEFLFDQNF